MSDPIIQVSPLSNRWQTLDPFLFCVHHVDLYPKGNDRFGPDAPLAGHEIGQDFDNQDGWRMYHGDIVPGFPQHPHRGFETVTIVRKGYIDHSDSLGAAARFGMGDVQWLTAGAGVVHSEMFPLLDRQGPNTLELFQIWLNLPAKNKLADAVLHDVLGQGHPAAPGIRASWSPSSPARSTMRRRWHRRRIHGRRATMPTSRSGRSRWSRARRGWCRRRATRAATVRCTSSPARASRSATASIDGPSMIRVDPNQPIPLEAVNGPVEILLLQGRPIGEPVAQHGPFVMNTRAELGAGVRRLSPHAVRRLAVARETRRCTRATRAASRSTRDGRVEKV